MNTNTFYFLRHGKTVQDSNIPATDWVLTEDTSKTISNVVKNERYQKISKIYTSTEHKAQKSAEPFALQLSLSIKVFEGLEEVHRGNEYLSDDEFMTHKKKQLENHDYKNSEGESANEALTRFVNAIKIIDKQHTNSQILIVSHGTILALYFCFLNNDFNNVFSYWRNMNFGATGTVKENLVFDEISNTS